MALCAADVAENALSGVADQIMNKGRRFLP